MWPVLVVTPVSVSRVLCLVANSDEGGHTSDVLSRATVHIANGLFFPAVSENTLFSIANSILNEIGHGILHLIGSIDHY
jgi:hypothetical protein